MASAVIGALRVNLGIDTAAFEKSLGRAQGGLKRFGAAVRTGFLAAGAAAAASIGALGLAVKGTIDAADEMSKAAQKFGIPIEELSRLKYAADLSGVSMEGLGTGVRRLSQNMNDASMGLGEGKAAFDQLGISVTNADGTLKSASQVMAEMADKFAAMPDGAAKTALAMDLMGRSGADMIPLLNGGSAALQELMAEADTFGQVFTQEMGSNAERFNDNMSRLTGAVGSVVAEIAERLLPYMAQFSDWLVANAPRIADAAVGVVDLAVSLGRLAGDIISLGQTIVAFVQDAWTRFEAAWESLIEIRGRVIQAMVEMKDQAIQAVADMVTGIGDWITNKLSAIWDGAIGKVKEFVGWFSWANDEVVQHSYIPDMVKGVEKWMGRLEKSFGDSIGGLVGGTMSFREALAGLLQDLASFALGKMNLGGGFFGSLLQSLFGSLPGFADGGTFKVGGAGGIDSKVAAMRLTPGEIVDIRKPGNDNRGGPVSINVNVDGATGNSEVRMMVAAGIQAGLSRYEREVNNGQMLAAKLGAFNAAAL